jgi:hypothetical protein
LISRPIFFIASSAKFATRRHRCSTSSSTSRKTGIAAGEFLWYHQDLNFWGGMPADRHGQSGAMSRADGHAEMRRWRFPKKDRVAEDLVRNQADLEDFKYLTSGRARESDYTPSWWASVPQ